MARVEPTPIRSGDTQPVNTKDAVCPGYTIDKPARGALPPDDGVRTATQINAEKAEKSRMDLVPPDLTELAGLSFGVGARKHGLGPQGLGTYRVPGCEQATVASHWASMRRHMAELEKGNWMDDAPGGTGLPHLACFAAQASIVASLMMRPPGPVRPSDRRWYEGRETHVEGGLVHYATSEESWEASNPEDPRVSHFWIRGEDGE